ncbi:MAG TPA: hypothetical protein PKZ52_19165, partial [Cellvibrionaceae bacterium]|nr:hypothetical protein [Cellvibrionaceae bacterium]
MRVVLFYFAAYFFSTIALSTTTMIQLDGLVLPSGLRWSDEFTTTSVAQSARRTLDGSLVVF